MSKIGIVVAIASVFWGLSPQAYAQPADQQPLSQPGAHNSYQTFVNLTGATSSDPETPPATGAAHTAQQPTAVTPVATPAPLTDVEEQTAQAIADSAWRFQCLQGCLIFRAVEDSTCRYGGTALVAAGVALAGVSIPAWLPASLVPILQWVGLGSIVGGHGCQLGSSYVHSRAEADARISARVRQILAERARGHIQ